MQQEQQRSRSNVYFIYERRGRPLKSSAEGSSSSRLQNFAEVLPVEMSERIFSSLDAGSLVSASLTCRLWNLLIQEMDSLWRNPCLSVRAVCQREVDRDRGDGLSWKVTLVRNYQRSFLKRDWLRGRYSNVMSPDELRDRRMCPLDRDTWGEILEAELER